MNKSNAIECAKGLKYGEEIILKLKNAKSDKEINRILATGRHNLKDDSEELKKENKNKK